MAIQGKYLPEPTKPLRPFPDPSMPNTTINVSAGQSAAFLLLNDGLNFSNRFPIIAAEMDKPDAYSAMGTPVYGRIVLGEDGADGTDGNLNKYTDAQGAEQSYRTVELDCALVTVDFNKKVVVTNIQGLDDPIVEFISNGGNDVTITGIFNSTPGVAPLEFISNLNSIFDASVPIPVTNYYLNLLNINYIVIMPGTSMGQLEAGYATQTFTIKALSTTPMTEMLP